MPAPYSYCGDKWYHAVPLFFCDHCIWSTLKCETFTSELRDKGGRHSQTLLCVCMSVCVGKGCSSHWLIYGAETCSESAKSLHKQMCRLTNFLSEQQVALKWTINVNVFRGASHQRSWFTCMWLALELSHTLADTLNELYGLCTRICLTEVTCTYITWKVQSPHTANRQQPLQAQWGIF